MTRRRRREGEEESRRWNKSLSVEQLWGGARD